jgi:hypothetical protein
VNVDTLFMGLLETTKFDACAPARFSGRQAARYQFLDTLIDMKAQFPVDPLTKRMASHEIQQPAHDSSLGCPKNEPNRVSQTPPVSPLGVKLFSAQSCEAVKLRLPARVARPPFGPQPPLLLKAVKRRVQRPLLHSDDGIRDLVEPLRDRVSVNRTEGRDLQDQHIERTLQQISFVLSHLDT